MVTSVGRIHKEVVLRAPIQRVWEAISDSEQFGRWFGARFEGPFRAGTRVKGEIAKTEMDPEVASYQEPYAGQPFELLVERVDPPRHFAFRWHPGAEPDEDATDESMTLVTFDLEEVEEGTRLVIQETGFDGIEAERRAKVFEENRGGWEIQARLVRLYVERP